MAASDIVALWHHVATWVLVNIASSDGLVLNSTKPLPETMLTRISEFLWLSVEGNSTGNTQNTLAWYELKNVDFGLNFSGTSELKSFLVNSEDPFILNKQYNPYWWLGDTFHSNSGGINWKHTWPPGMGAAICVGQ